MPKLIDAPTNVPLWAGWSIELPLAYYERNPDGSWAAWGEDWTIDVTIVEIGGDGSGNPVSPENLLGPDRPVTIAGRGWIGSHEVIQEEGDALFRLASSLAAVNTVCSCWVSVKQRDRLQFAESLVSGVSHGQHSEAYPII